MGAPGSCCNLGDLWWCDWLCLTLADLGPFLLHALCLLPGTVPGLDAKTLSPQFLEEVIKVCPPRLAYL